MGHILFNDISIRSTNFAEKNIILKFVQDYLYLSVGGLIESGENLKNLHEENQIFQNYRQFEKQYLSEDMKREKDQVAPKEFPNEFEGAEEYALSIWSKWSTIGRAAWEAISTLTYYEPSVRANQLKPGDRVLSMFKYADHRTLFSSYSNLDNNNAFS